MVFIKQNKDNLTINIYVVPGSSRNEITGIYNGALKIKLNASPVDNKANEELINFLSKKLKVSKSSIEIVSGFRKKKKIILLKGLNYNTVIGLLEIRV